MARYASFQYERDFGDVYALLAGMEHDLDGEALSEFAVTEVYPYLRERAMNRFASKGDDAVGRWPELRQSTQERRIHAGYGGSDPINIRTHGLERYIQEAQPDVFVSGGAVVMVYPGDLPDDQELERKYKTAQQGRDDRSRTPPRPIIAVSTEDYVWVRERLHEHIMSRG